MREQGKGVVEIAREIGKAHTSISREIKRNKIRKGKYIACKAQEKAEQRSREQRTKAPLKNPDIFLYVREHLRDYHWTPQQIAGRLKLEKPGCSICTETIYQYIYGKGKRYKLWEHLTIQRPKRMKKMGRKVKRSGSIPNAKSIELRPKTVDRRSRKGDWESDMVIGKQSDQGALNVEYERSSRFVMLDKLDERTAQAKLDTQVRRYTEIPQRLRRTITHDNGKENSNHEQLTEQTGADIYFTHPYCSWEKGGVENTNGRVRLFIPKGESIDSIPNETIAYIEYRMNNTPRKCLGFMTPYEKMFRKKVVPLPPPK